MKWHPAGQWYVDIRTTSGSEDLSFDLSQHLPRRLSVGPVLVVHDTPAVFLSVIRKRWMKLLKDIVRLHAQTLDHRKRDSFSREIHHLRACRFTSKQRLLQRTDALFVDAQSVDVQLPGYVTAYITQPISPQTLAAVLVRLHAGGLLVIYEPWQAAYDQVLGTLE